MLYSQVHTTLSAAEQTIAFEESLPLITRPVTGAKINELVRLFENLKRRRRIKVLLLRME